MGKNGGVNLAHALADTAERLPDKLVLIPSDGGEPWTYRRLRDEAARVAGWLKGGGVEPGDRVAIAINNRPEFAAAYLGTLSIGAVAVPLNVMLSKSEMSGIIADAGVAAIIGVPPFGALAAEVAGIELVAPEGLEAMGELGGSFEIASGSDEDLAVLAYTSGTTGEPKGAMLTHGNLSANLDQQMAIPADTVLEGDVLFMALPLFHIYGMNVTLGLLIRNGATGVLVDRFDPVPALRAIVDHQATVLFGAPTMYRALVNTPGADQYDLSHVRLAISGAAPLPAEALRSFEDITGVKIYEGYGLTETSPTLMSCRMAPEPRPSSVGMPLPGIEVKLLDEHGDEVDLGDPGEVVVRGANVFSGYWKRPDDSAAVLRDGWFYTGDIAVQDEDGYYYLVDRKRDLIIVSGFNVFPSEVEAALMKSDRVSEAAVVGVPHVYTGEAVKAFVVLEEGTSATPEELLAEVQGHLARFKCPEAIEIVPELPHLATGKVLKRALRA